MGHRTENSLLPLQSTSNMANISHRQSQVAEQEQRRLPVRQLGHASLEPFGRVLVNASDNPAVSTVIGTEMVMNNEARGLSCNYTGVDTTHPERQVQYLAYKSGTGLSSEPAYLISSNLRSRPVTRELVG